MKTIKIELLVFGVLAIMCSSCSSKCCVEQANQHVLFIGVLDMVGNDLVKGIAVGDDTDGAAHWGPKIKSDMYTFEIIYPDLCMDIGKHPVQVEETDILNYLVFDVGASTNNGCPDAGILTYKLKCLYIFGDDVVHELVTYWKEGNEPTKSRLCYRIVLDGKSSTEDIVHERNNQTSRATLRLESK
jgi:hypothetical protein